MFEAASFSLRSLFVFRPLVRGGEGAEKFSDSEFPLTKGPRIPVLPGLGSREPKRWDLS